MICSSNVPVTGSKLFHIDCHDDVAHEVVLGQTAFDAAHQSKVFQLCKDNHDSDMPLGQTACDAAHTIRAYPLGQTACDAAHESRAFHLCKERHDIAEQDDHQDVHGVRVGKMCIGEVTEEDMLCKLLEHEDRGHEEDSGWGGFSWKGEQESALERRRGMGIWRIGIGRIRGYEGTRTVGGLEETGIRIRIRIGTGNAGAQGWCC